jgi:hypothetical protein
MFHPEINAETQNLHLGDKILQQKAMNTSGSDTMDVVKLNLLHENQLLRERNNQLTQLNNNLMIEISQLKLEIDMMELKKALCQEER